MDKQSQISPNLSRNDHLVNASQAIIKGIPYLGGSLEQFIFGPLNKLRMRRMECTLKEIVKILHERNCPIYMENEYFVNLLESIAPSLSRSLNEERRKCFKNLLLNVAQTQLEDSTWEEAKLASHLLDTIDSPGLAILAAIYMHESDAVYLFQESPPNNLNIISDMQYEWTVIKEWAIRLKEMRIIIYEKASDVLEDNNPGPDPSTKEPYDEQEIKIVFLTDLGKLLVRWVISDNSLKTE